MATFPATIKPHLSSTLDREYKVLTSGFGDGYEQRAADGINNQRDKWNLVFKLSAADFATVKAFLDARQGYEEFTWTPPVASNANKWVCKEYSVSRPGVIYVIDAVFEGRYTLV